MPNNKAAVPLSAFVLIIAGLLTSPSPAAPQVAQKEDRKIEAEFQECLSKLKLATDSHGKLVHLSTVDLKARALNGNAACVSSGTGKGTSEGVVILEVAVGSDGALKCARGVSGHPLAYSPAMACVAEWKFRPYLQHGKPRNVRGTLKVPYRFTY